MNREAKVYYGLTEDAYRLLHKPETPFMNLGLWPASNLLEAQARLVRRTAERLKSVQVYGDEKPCILELGPGWGGSRSILAELFPDAHYWGLNLSARQVDFAKRLNADVPHTTYFQGFFETLSQVVERADLVFGVESILHVEDKRQLFADLKAIGMRSFAFAEICLNREQKASRFFQPALTHAYEVEQYHELLEGFCARHTIEDCTVDIFRGWAEYLDSMDPDLFPGQKRILRQFQDGYRTMAELADQGAVTYLILSGVIRD